MRTPSTSSRSPTALAAQSTVERRSSGAATEQLIGTGLVVASAMAFGVMPVLAKFAYAGGATPLAVVAIRFAVASLLFWGWFGVMRRPPRVSGRRAMPLLALGIVYSANALAAFIAFHRIPVSTANLLFWICPAIVAALSALLGERLGWMRWGAIGTAVAGSWLTIGGAPSGEDPVGFVAILVSSFLYAGYIIVAPRLMRDVPPLEATALLVLGTTVVISVGGAVTGTLQLDFGPDGWIPAIAIGVVSTAFAIGTFLAGAIRLGASRAALVATLEPVVTVIASFFTLGEVLTPLQLAGALLILGAVVVQQATRD